MTRVEWRHDTETSRLLHALALAAFAAIGALFVAVAGLALLVVTGALLAGELAVIAVVAAAAVLFARRLAAQVALARHTDTYPLPLRELAAASALWATADALCLELGVPFAFVVVPHLLAVFVGLPLAAALASEGVVDTDAGVLEVGNRETPLNAVQTVSRYDLGPATVLRVRYHDGTGGSSAPRWLGVLPSDAARVRTALESSGDAPPESSSRPLVAVVLGSFGVGFLAFAGFLAYVAATSGSDGGFVVGYAAVVVGVFAALFLVLGLRER